MDYEFSGNQYEYAQGQFERPDDNETRITDTLNMISASLIKKEEYATIIKQRAEKVDRDVKRLKLVLSPGLHPKNVDDFLRPYEQGIEFCQRYLKTSLRELNEAVSEHPFHEFRYAWKNEVQQAVGVAIYLQWMGNNGLPVPEEVNNILGIPFEVYVDKTRGSRMPLHYTVEDYLHGAVGFTNELPRVLVNIVSSYMICKQKQKDAGTSNPSFAGATKLVVESIHDVILQSQKLLYALDLKNDSLRRRVDSVKYDVKKVEEVMYDLTIRGILTEV